jgi:Acyl-CoA carboxylase epsilon subunit
MSECAGRTGVGPRDEGVRPGVPERERARRDPPHLRIVRGEPDAAELAALLAVVAARAAARPAPAEPVRSSWADPARRLRAAPAAGPGAWRRSATPR